MDFYKTYVKSLPATRTLALIHKDSHGDEFPIAYLPKRELTAPRQVMEEISKRVNEHDALTAERDELAAEVKRLREAMEAAEWGCQFRSQMNRCSVCGAARGHQHAADCIVGNALNPPEGT